VEEGEEQELVAVVVAVAVEVRPKIFDHGC
jgi:hypothetical protein